MFTPPLELDDEDNDLETVAPVRGSSKRRLAPSRNSILQKKALVVEEDQRHGSSSFIDDDNVPGSHLESLGEEVEQVVFQRKVREADFVQKFTWYLAYLFNVMIGARPWDDQEMSAVLVEHVPRTMLENTPTAYWSSSDLLNNLCTFTKMVRLPDSECVGRCGGCGRSKENVQLYELKEPSPISALAWESEALLLHYLWSESSADYAQLSEMECASGAAVKIAVGRQCATRLKRYQRLCHYKGLLCARLTEELRARQVTNPREFDAWALTGRGREFIACEAKAWELIQVPACS